MPRRKITVKTDVELAIPVLPNFIRTVNKDIAIPIADLKPCELKEIGDAWVKALLVKASRNRKRKKLGDIL
jgi:hypothetical protein